jgi:hypothetical protein
LAAGCSIPQPISTTGTVVISPDYQKPPPSQPISIGGTAIFTTLTSPEGRIVRGGGHLSEVTTFPDLSPGDYDLAVRLAPASDAISCDGDRNNCRREFGPTSATCGATVQVEAGVVTDVVITAIGGEACTIGAAT